MIVDYYSYFVKYFVCFCCDLGIIGLEQELIGNGDVYYIVLDFYFYIIIVQVGKGVFEVEYQCQVQGIFFLYFGCQVFNELVLLVDVFQGFLNICSIFFVYNG